MPLMISTKDATWPSCRAPLATRYAAAPVSMCRTWPAMKALSSSMFTGHLGCDGRNAGRNPPGADRVKPASVRQFPVEGEQVGLRAEPGDQGARHCAHVDV